MPSWWPDARPVVYALTWVVCLGVAAARLHHARTEYDTADKPAEWVRPDDNAGHTHIDFGGQWVMGRMVATGHARELYDRNVQWQVVRAGYPREREPQAPREQSFPLEPGAVDLAGDQIRHDADNLLTWFLGKDSPRWREFGGAATLPFAADPANPFAVIALTAASADRVTPDLAAAVTAKAVGGPLYPPVHGFLYAPLGFFSDPATAYAVFQYLAVAVTFVAGLAISCLSRGRVWWPAATAAVLLYPGCRAGLDLGQNPTVTLAVLVGGWALAARGKEEAGGIVWGFLAYKPVWAVAFLLIPLLAGRWRFAIAMTGTGAGLALGTMFYTGMEPWLDWVTNGRAAAANYEVNKSWIELSRDLFGIPRRILVDFSRPNDERRNPTATAVGWGLWAAVLVTTTVVYRLRADRRNRTGLGAAFLFLGAFLGCFHFMYYDSLLSLAGVALLFADPARLVRFATGEPAGLPFGPRWAGRLLAPPVLIVGLLFLCENCWQAAQPAATVEAEGWAYLTADDVRKVPRLTGEIGYYHPWETLLVIVLWAWCGWRLAWGPDIGEQ